MRAIWNGWSAGIAPGHKAVPIGRGDCALAGIAAGALAVGHCFLAEQGQPNAGRAMQGLSLWNPDIGDRWLDEPGPPEKDVFLPIALWLVGLGNLGQAFLWSLSWLPYVSRNDLLLFLQDDDLVGKENWGTSILVEKGCRNVLKTRICEKWAAGVGFRVRRIDRRLDGSLKRGPHEPASALGPWIGCLHAGLWACRALTISSTRASARRRMIFTVFGSTIWRVAQSRRPFRRFRKQDGSPPDH